MKYRELEGPTDCPSCIAWHAEYQRAALLLERLAEDRFPDQATFDEWMRQQMGQVFRSRGTAPQGAPREAGRLRCSVHDVLLVPYPVGDHFNLLKMTLCPVCIGAPPPLAAPHPTPKDPQ